jgi:hypothetical protein
MTDTIIVTPPAVTQVTVSALATANVLVTSPIINTGTSAAPIIGINQTLLSLSKTQVGLTNVDNTADTAKPVSTAQQTALDLKANLVSPTFTGIPLAPTATAGTNTTQIATTAFVGTAVSNLVNSAPATLDTLNELATALGNDPAFATTIAASIGSKEPAITAGTTAQYLRGDKSLATFPTVVSSFTNDSGYLTSVPVATVGTSSTGTSGTVKVDGTTITISSGVISGANTYSLPTANSTTVGGIKLFSNTTQTVAAATISATDARTYGAQLNASNQLVVNVPWTDSDTTYILASGTNNGTLKLTPSSGTVQDNIAVTGLGSNAYTSTAIPAASSTTPIVDGTAAVGTGTTYARADHVHPTDTTRAALTGATFTGAVVLPPGTNAPLVPLKFVKNTTTPAATDGGMDYDGDKFYATTSGTATGRLMVPVKAMAFSNANSSSATSSTPVSIFPVGAQTLPLEAGKTYYFRLNLGFNYSYNSVPGNIQIVPTFSNAPVSINYSAVFQAGNTDAKSTRVTSTTATSINAGGTSSISNATALVEGYFQSNATTGGTVEFKFSISSGGGSSVTATAGSLQEIVKIGTGVPLAVSGTWS